MTNSAHNNTHAIVPVLYRAGEEEPDIPQPTIPLSHVYRIIQLVLCSCTRPGNKRPPSPPSRPHTDWLDWTLYDTSGSQHAAKKETGKNPREKLRETHRVRPAEPGCLNSERAIENQPTNQPQSLKSPSPRNIIPIGPELKINIPGPESWW